MLPSARATTAVMRRPRAAVTVRVNRANAKRKTRLGRMLADQRLTSVIELRTDAGRQANRRVEIVARQ